MLFCCNIPLSFGNQAGHKKGRHQWTVSTSTSPKLRSKKNKKSANMITRWNLSKNPAPVECGVLGWLAFMRAGWGAGRKKGTP